MTVKQLTGAPSTNVRDWNSLKWDKAESEVKRLQMRIAKAVKEKRYGKSSCAAMSADALVLCKTAGG